MGKLHEALCRAFPGCDVAAIKEWANERGEMGIYHETAPEGHEIYEESCYVIAALLADGRFARERLAHGHVKMMLENATILAAFAGATTDGGKIHGPI